MTKYIIENIKSLNETGICHRNRIFEYDDFDTNRNINVQRSLIVKDTIKYALKNNLKALAEKQSKNAYDASQLYSKWVMHYMNSRYVECDFKVIQQQQEQVLWDWRRVMRYLKTEQRLASKEDVFGTVFVGREMFKVSPDLVFETNEDTVEYVYLKNSAPFSIRTNNSSSKIEMLHLYALCKFAMLKGYKNVKASYYFMKDNSDSNVWAHCPISFTSIISVEQFYGSDDLEKEFSPLIQSLEQGISEEQMDEKKCKLCPHYDICKYQLPPKTSEEEKTSEEIAMESEFPKIDYSEEQQKVIDCNEGIIRVIAAAGSGKTQTVAGRVKKLLADGTAPENVLCITFSDAGAKEMRRKIERMIGPSAEQLKILTFHSLNYEICKDNYVELGFKKPLTVIDEVQKYSIINTLMKKYPIYEWTGKSFMHYGVSTNAGVKGALAIVNDIFSQIKSNGLDWKTICSTDVEYDWTAIPEKAVNKVIGLYGKYDEMCKQKGLISFDDMETYAEKVLNNNPNYLSNTYAFEHIIIDEFQDTSEGQMELVKRLKQIKTYKSLMIVGDDAQAIYEFRGTTPKYIIDFKDEVNSSLKNGTPVRQDEVKDLFLTKNYRSKQEILDFASNILLKNEDQISKHIVASREGKGEIQVEGFCNFDDEYAWIAKQILSRVEAGEKIEDIAVLAYTKAELRKVADALTKEGIPSMFGAPQPVIENSRIRALLAFARVIENNSDTKDAAIVANAVYKTEDDSDIPFMELDGDEVSSRVESILSLAESIKSDSVARGKEKFLNFVEQISMQDETVTKFAEQFENKDLKEILQYCKDFDEFGLNQQYRTMEDYPGVKLLTIHSSKGLEWKAVFLTLNGYRHKRRQMSKKQLEEVRRLLFVAMTRARDYLAVTGQWFDAFSADSIYGISKDNIYNETLKEVFDVNQIPWAADSEMCQFMAEKATKLAEKKKASSKAKKSSSKKH